MSFLYLNAIDPVQGGVEQGLEQFVSAKPGMRQTGFNAAWTRTLCRGKSARIWGSCLSHTKSPLPPVIRLPVFANESYAFKASTMK